MRTLVLIIVAGLLVPVAASVAFGQDRTGALFQAGMGALNAAHTTADREGDYILD